MADDGMMSVNEALAYAKKRAEVSRCGGIAAASKEVRALAVLYRAMNLRTHLIAGLCAEGTQAHGDEFYGPILDIVEGGRD